MKNLTNSQTITLFEISNNNFQIEKYSITISNKKPLINQILNYLQKQNPDYLINFKINKKSIKFELFQFENSNYYKTENYFKLKIELSQIF